MAPYFGQKSIAIKTSEAFDTSNIFPGRSLHYVINLEEYRGVRVYRMYISLYCRSFVVNLKRCTCLPLVLYNTTGEILIPGNALYFIVSELLMVTVYHSLFTCLCYMYICIPLEDQSVRPEVVFIFKQNEIKKLLKFHVKASR